MATPEAGSEGAHGVSEGDLVACLLEVMSLVAAYPRQRQQDPAAERVLFSLMESIRRLHDERLTSIEQRGKLTFRTMLADVYRHVDDRGALTHPDDLVPTLCRVPTHQADALRQVFMLEEGKREAFVKRWCLTRERVSKLRGPVEAAGICVAEFFGDGPRSYYYWAKEHGTAPRTADEDDYYSERFGVVDPPTAVLRRVLTMLEVPDDVALDAATRIVAASPVLARQESSATAPRDIPPAPRPARPARRSAKS